MSISNAQRTNLNDLELLAGEDITQFVEVTSALDRIAKKFLENLENNINQAKFAGSGSLVKNMTYRKSDDGKSVDIILLTDPAIFTISPVPPMLIVVIPPPLVPIFTV